MIQRNVALAVALRRQAFALIFTTVSLAQPLGPAAPVDDFTGHPRLIVISDIGNEPDDQMSLVRLLLYSNESAIRNMSMQIPSPGGTIGCDQS